MWYRAMRAAYQGSLAFIAFVKRSRLYRAIFKLVMKQLYNIDYKFDDEVAEVL